jgi:TonB family protein
MLADRRPMTPALSGSLAIHLLVVALLAFAAARSARAPSQRPRESPLVWTTGGGGGGSGRGQLGEPQPAQKRGRDPATIAGVRDRSAIPTPAASPPDNLPSTVVASVVSIAGREIDLPGVMAAPPGVSTESHGPGNGDGFGSGRGPCTGPGDGVGAGPGSDAGVGGGPFQPGGDVTMPIEIRKGTPQYTLDAMRARAAGVITVECVVQTTGMCTNIRVLRSFQPSFGLDGEAIKAAAQWRFRPGTRRGRPVPVVITMQIEFAIR